MTQKEMIQKLIQEHEKTYVYQKAMESDIDTYVSLSMAARSEFISTIEKYIAENETNSGATNACLAIYYSAKNDAWGVVEYVINSWKYLLGD